MRVVRDVVELVELALDFEDDAGQLDELGVAVQLVEVVVEEHQTLHQELLGHHHQLDHVELPAQDQPLGAVHEELLAEGPESTHRYFWSFSLASISRKSRWWLAIAVHAYSSTTSGRYSCSLKVDMHSILSILPRIIFSSRGLSLRAARYAGMSTAGISEISYIFIK